MLTNIMKMIKRGNIKMEKARLELNFQNSRALIDGMLMDEIKQIIAKKIKIARYEMDLYMIEKVISKIDHEGANLINEERIAMNKRATSIIKTQVIKVLNGLNLNLDLKTLKINR